MSLSFELSGQQGDVSSVIRNAHVYPFKTFAGRHNGALVLTKPFQEFLPTSLPFLNPTLGNAMNQDVTAGGTEELIFDGTGVGGWTSSTATSGAEWDLTDGGKVTVDHGANSSFATFTDSSTSDSSAFAALSGKVDLDNYTPGTQNLLIQFKLSGAPVGDQLGLNDYIDTSDFAEQSFTIAMTDFALGGGNVDGFTITIERTAGHNPHVSFDDFQLEESGSPVVFTVKPDGHDIHVKKIRFTFIDNVTGASALTYNKILGLTSLPNGFDVKVVLDGETLIAANIREFADFIMGGSDIVLISDDGTNTMLGIDLILSDPIILKSGHGESDFMSITINDNMSDLLSFTALVGASNELIGGK